MKIQRILIGALCALALSGCTRAVEQMKSATWAEVVGTLGGAALAAAAGAQFGGGLGQTIFMATGALVGGGVGYSAAPFTRSNGLGNLRENCAEGAHFGAERRGS